MLIHLPGQLRCHKVGASYLGRAIEGGALCLFSRAEFKANLHPVFDQGVESAVKIVQSKGFSANRNICREEKKMELEEIRDLFGVPCSRLEFQRFDERLNAAIQESTGRPRP